MFVQYLNVILISILTSFTISSVYLLYANKKLDELFEYEKKQLDKLLNEFLSDKLK